MEYENIPINKEESNNTDLESRDGIESIETDQITITSEGISEFLLMQVLMENQ